MKAIKSRTQQFFINLIPFIGIGIFLVLLVAAFVVFSYLLILGSLIGLILFVIVYIKQRFFSKTSHNPPARGKTYNHEDL